jgi:hypothetical protein
MASCLTTVGVAQTPQPRTSPYAGASDSPDRADRRTRDGGRCCARIFLDPRSGSRRRKLVRDRVRRTVRRRARAVERQAHYEAGKVIGLTHAIAHRHHDTPELDDVTLVRKVESELYRDRTIPKGQISINADRGIVVLRGELDDSQQIRHIENAARKIFGVRDVENLLHKPGVPVPPSHPHPEQRTTRPAAKAN